MKDILDYYCHHHDDNDEVDDYDEGQLVKLSLSSVLMSLWLVRLKLFLSSVGLIVFVFLSVL